MRRVFLIPLSLLLMIAAGCNRSADYYVNRGNQFFDAQKYEDASIQYRKGIQKKPNFGEAYYRLGLSEIKRKNLTDAYDALRKAVELMPVDDAAKVKLADVCLTGYVVDPRNVVLYNQVLSISDELLAKNRNSLDGLRLKGLLALSDRKPKEAIQYLEKAEAVKSMDPDVVVGLSQALMADNRFAEGEKLALALIQKDKTFGPIYNVLYFQYRGAKRFADAERILRAKVENNPQRESFVLELAEHYARDNREPETTKTLRQLLDRPKDFPDVHLMVGDFYGRHGKWSDAMIEFQEGLRAANSKEEKTGYQKRIVVGLQAQGKMSEALQALTPVLKDNPKDEEARIAHATLLLESRKTENIDLAIPEFQKLAQERPADAELRFNLGRVFQFKNQPEDARSQFQQAVRLRNNYMEPRVALVMLNLNQLRAHDALVGAKELVDADATNPQSRFLYVAALTQVGNYEEARLQIAQILKQAPGSRDAQLQLGLVAVAQKRFKEAQEIFGRLHQLNDGDIRPTTGLVNIYSTENQFEKALQLLSEDLKKSPNSTQIRALLASTATRAGKYDLAISEYQKLIPQAPNSANLRIGLAQAFSRNGDLPNAITTLEQAMQVEPKNSEALAYLASTLATSGRLAQSKSRYQQLLGLQPDNPEVQNDLAFVLTETGDNLDEALRLVQRAITKKPNSSSFQDTLGWIYFKKSQTDSALQVFNALVKKEPDKPTFRYHLGAALLQRGDKQGAQTQLRAALGQKPSQEEEANIRQLLARAD